MRRLFISTAFIIGASAIAAAAPNYEDSVSWGDSTETDAELSTVLEGWVDETVEAAKREAEELAAVARENGIPVPQVRHEIEHFVHFESPEIVSVLREDWAYEGGGANGSLWLIPVNWDARAGALIPIQAVLGEPDDNRDVYERLARMLHDATARQIRDGEAQGWDAAPDAAIQPDPMFLSTFTFVPSTEPDRIGGIAWHFEPYTVAPGAEGTVTVVIAQAQLRDLVAPEWRELLAGEPVDALNARYVAPEGSPLQTVLAQY